MMLPTGYGIGQSGGVSTVAAESSAVRCKFGETVVVGTIIDLSTVICTAPAASLSRVASSSPLSNVPLLVSVDHGWTYLTPVESVFTYFSDPIVTSVAPLMVIENQRFYLKLQGVFPLSTLFCRLGIVHKQLLHLFHDFALTAVSLFFND